MDDATTAKVVDMYQQGASTAQIVRCCGVSAGSIYTALRRAGLGPSRQGRTWNQAAVDMYRDGKPLADIVTATGVGASAIYHHLAAAGVSPDRQRRP